MYQAPKMDSLIDDRIMVLTLITHVPFEESPKPICNLFVVGMCANWFYPLSGSFSVKSNQQQEVLLVDRVQVRASFKGFFIVTPG